MPALRVQIPQVVSRSQIGTDYGAHAVALDEAGAEFVVVVPSLAPRASYEIFCHSVDDSTLANANDPADILASRKTALLIDETRPTLSLSCAPTVGSESSITATVSLSEAGTVWCAAVRNLHSPPTSIDIRDAGFSAVLSNATAVTIDVTQEYTGVMRTGPATLVEKQDYVLSCWAFDDQQPSSLCKTCGYRRNDLAVRDLGRLSNP